MTKIKIITEQRKYEKSFSRLRQFMTFDYPNNTRQTRTIYTLHQILNLPKTCHDYNWWKKEILCRIS